MKRLNGFVVLVSLAVALLCGSSYADESIVRYSHANAQTYPQLTPTFVNPKVSASTLVGESGILAANSTTNWRWYGFNPAWQSYDQGVAAKKYWHFSLTVTNALTSVKLTQLDIRVGKTNTNGPRKFEIRASVNKGAAIPVFLYDFFAVYGDAVVDVFFQIDLGNIPEIRTGDEVFFWLVPHTQYGSTSGPNFYMQNINTKTYGLEVRGQVERIPVGTCIMIR